MAYQGGHRHPGQMDSRMRGSGPRQRPGNQSMPPPLINRPNCYSGPRPPPGQGGPPPNPHMAPPNYNNPPNYNTPSNYNNPPSYNNPPAYNNPPPNYNHSSNYNGPPNYNFNGPPNYNHPPPNMGGGARPPPPPTNHHQPPSVPQQYYNMPPNNQGNPGAGMCGSGPSGNPGPGICGSGPPSGNPGPGICGSGPPGNPGPGICGSGPRYCGPGTNSGSNQPWRMPPHSSIPTNSPGGQNPPPHQPPHQQNTRPGHAPPSSTYSGGSYTKQSNSGGGPPPLMPDGYGNDRRNPPDRSQGRNRYRGPENRPDKRSERPERSDGPSRHSRERRPYVREDRERQPSKDSLRRDGRREYEPTRSEGQRPSENTQSESQDGRESKRESKWDQSPSRQRRRDRPEPRDEKSAHVEEKNRRGEARKDVSSPPRCRDQVKRSSDREKDKDSFRKRGHERDSPRERNATSRTRDKTSSSRDCRASPRRARSPRPQTQHKARPRGRRSRSRSRAKSREKSHCRDRPRESGKASREGSTKPSTSSSQVTSDNDAGDGGDSVSSSPSRDYMEDDDARYTLLSNLLDQEVNPDEENTEKKEPEEEPVIGPDWMRCSPADLYFRRELDTNCMLATKKMLDLEEKFDSELIQRANKVRATKPPYVKPPRANPVLAKHMKKHCHHQVEGSDSGSSSSDDDSDLDNDVAHGWMEELNRKQEHPERLHQELWFNEPGEMNDGPLCRCNVKSCNSGIRHDIYPGEHLTPRCEPDSNNKNKLYHYRITMSPHTNFLTKNPTVIEYDNHEYIFEGFSILSHYKLHNVPVCRVIRFNIEYTIHWFEEEVPENFSVKSLDLFTDYFFYEILELLDLDWKPKGAGCSRFHLMPRFARDLPDNGKEILSMNEVLLYLLRSARPLLEESELNELLKYEKHEWQAWVDRVRGMIVTFPGMRPSSIRIDQLDREQSKDDVINYPMIIHFGIRPAQLSYAGDPNYQKLWKQYVKFKHLLANKPKITLEDKAKLERKEDQLQEMRMKSTMKREVTVELNSQGFTKSGIKSDMCQHAMLLPVLIVHLRFHKCLDVLEGTIRYKFKDRMLLQLALTHPSYRVNFGTNPDHARNSLSNCGIRHPEYGDRRIHHVHTRKRGINTLINIMSRLGRKEETVSEINHYERLEFLGDAVVEFMSSIHLYFMFPSLEEGGLATYRAAIVQNQHLAVLAKKLKLQDFMLYAHGPDLCHESDLRHAMANCLEALMGALFLDDGIELADRIFGEVLYDEDVNLLDTWQNLPVHPLQEDEPNGDRQWIASSPALQKLCNFEESIGMNFTHVRLLARSFTMRNVGYNNLTFGHNQRLEFLGDTVLQLIASDYLFKHFPEHHEGHLSLLRSSLVNNRTQAVVCDDLGMTEYIIHADNRLYDQAGMKHKEKADLLEAFIGALYVDKGLEHCRVFCSVCFFPRLKQFILNQDWNDPKSQLQQCCLTLRELDGGEPDIPVYKVIASTGPTNTRKYTVAVYFRGERLATGTGHSIQQSEMNAATNALADRGELFPQLAHQKKFIEKKYKRKRRKSKNDNEPKTKQIRNKTPPRKFND